MSTRDLGPVLFAYDGSDLAKLAIEEAGRQLGTGRDAIALTVWRPFVVGFVPVNDREFDAAASDEVRKAALETAAQGASLAQTAGFAAQTAEIEDTPTWKAISHFADKHDASLIVLGSHGKSGMAGAFLGSVAASVAGHSRRPVLIVHRSD
jgi:nucleotide-binding universal stress UspA family protein